MSDWAGMAEAMKIRVPLEDMVLLRKIAPWVAATPGPRKLGMTGTLKAPLPDEVLQRAKSAILVPVRRWLASASPPGVFNRDHDWRLWAQNIYPHHTAS